MVARQDGDDTFCVGRPLAAETNIQILGDTEKMLIIHKRLKIEGIFLLKTNHGRSTRWRRHFLCGAPPSGLI